MTPYELQGRYLSQAVTTILAAILARRNCVLVGEQGTGKTGLVLAILRHAYPNEHAVISLSPSASTSRITGKTDVAALLQGINQMVVTGTADDPRARVVLLDEFSRANDAVYDKMLPRMESLETRNQTFIGTANWMPNSERSQALLGRVALVNYMEPDVTPETVWDSAYAGLGQWERPAFPSHIRLPERAEIEAIQHMSGTEQSHYAITRVLGDLHAEIGSFNAKRPAKEHFDPRPPRRQRDWYDILFYWNCWQHGGNDFEQCDLSPLYFAYPALTQAAAAAWRSIVSNTDKTGVHGMHAIAQKMTQKFLEVQQKTAGNVIAQSQFAAELSRIGQGFSAEVISIFGEDSRERHEFDGILRELVKATARGLDPMDVLAELDKTHE